MSVVDHSRIAPSAFAITVPCPGSLQLQEKVPPQPDTEEIAEGKAAHHVAASFLRGLPMGVGTTFELNGRTWKVDEDMHDGAELWADTMGPDCQVEAPVEIHRVHGQCWGTPDGWRFFPDETPRRLRTGDYKYGHRFVDAFENLQVAGGYAVGILTQLGVSTGDDETIVEIVIVQPRAFYGSGPVQIWRTTPFKLNALLKRIRESVEAALTDNPPTNTGAHCLDCKARHICGTLRRSAAGVVDFSGTIEPLQLDTVAAATELAILDEAAERLESRRAGLFAQVEAAARSGQPVLYYGMEPGRSKFDWNDDVSVDEVAGFGQLLGVDLRKPPALMTPTQAVKALKVDEAVIKTWATRRPGGMSLKRIKDNVARKVFGGK